MGTKEGVEAMSWNLLMCDVCHSPTGATSD